MTYLTTLSGLKSLSLVMITFKFPGIRSGTTSLKYILYF